MRSVEGTEIHVRYNVYPRKCFYKGYRINVISSTAPIRPREENEAIPRTASLPNPVRDFSPVTKARMLYVTHNTDKA